MNAALGFGYALAAGEVQRALARVGLDARFGFFHGMRYGRVSLALDLLEELRAPLVDRFVLRCLNRRELQPEHFGPAEDPEARRQGGVHLTPEGRRRFLERWEALLGARPAGAHDDAELDAPSSQDADVSGRPARGDDDDDAMPADLEAAEALPPGEPRLLPARWIGRESEADADATTELDRRAARSWRGAIERQVHSLRRAILTGTEYEPLYRGPRGPRTRAASPDAPADPRGFSRSGRR